MTDFIRFRVANLVVEAHGEPIPPAIRSFVSGFPPSDDSPGLVFVFAGKLPGLPAQARSAGLLNATMQEKGLAFADYASSAAYEIVEEDGRYVVHVTTGQVSQLGRRQRVQSIRLLNPRYLTDEEQKLAGFFYGLWNYLVEILLLGSGASFIHASSVEKDGQALLLPAWGGVGKTSTMYQMILNGGWRFISDDLTILSRQGAVFFNPAALTVYPYNLRGLPEVEARFRALQGPIDRLQWRLGARLRGEDGVARRISPADLFGRDRLAAEARIARAIYLVRSNVPDFQLVSTTAEELARRAATVMLFEIRQFRFEYQAWTSIPGFSLFPGLVEVGECMQAVFAEALSGRDLAVLFVPAKASPVDLYRFISSRVGN